MFRMLLLVTMLAVLVGCSSGDSVAPRDEDQVTVFGVVTQIDDRVPVDGGVRITLHLDDGGTGNLYFGSLFTYPPPDDETLALYQKILAVEVGSHVKAIGVAVEGGIGLRDLVVLDS